MSGSEAVGRVDWIDLSARGLVMAVCEVGGVRLLAVAGASDQPTAAALGVLGFQRAAEELWVREGERVDFGPLLAAFPEARMTSVTAEEFNARHVIRGSETARPARDPDARDRRRAERASQLDALLAGSARLGTNHLGQEVWAARGDARFVVNRAGKGGDFQLLPEEGRANLNPGVFLRATTPAGSEACVESLVTALAAGGVRREGDLLRFAGVVLGDGTPLGRDDARVAEMDARIDVGAACWLGRRAASRSSRELFGWAQRIHEARAWRSTLASAPGGGAVTLPMSVAMQRMLGGEADLRGRDVLAVGHPSLGAFVAEGARVAAYSPDGEGLRSVLASVRRGSSARSASDAPPERPFAVACAPDGASAGVGEAVLDGVPVRRADIREAVRLLEARADDGRMVVSLATGGAEGLRELEAFHAWVARRWGVEGVAEVGGALTGANPETGARAAAWIMAVGVRRPASEAEPPAAAMERRAIADHADLWSWTGAVAVNRAKIGNFYAPAASELEPRVEGEGPVENRYQSPYVSLSRLGTATTMVPRNLEAATREGLSRIAAEHPDHDTWVCNRLGLTREEVAGRNGEEGRFSPEQLDAIAMTFHAWDRGRAALVADMTGLGKGRTMAGVALASIREGRKVLFLTERPLGFGEIARDFQDIGAWDELSPFVLNAGVQIRDETVSHLPDEEKPVLLESADPRLVSAMLEEGRWPEGANILFGTYSQFNRPGEVVERKRRRNAASTPAAATPAGGIPAPAVQAPNPAAGGLEQDDDAEMAGAEADIADMVAAAMDGEDGTAPAPALALAATQTGAEEGDDDPALEGSAIPAGVGPKSWWLRRVCDAQTDLILDESHNAANVASQSGANIAAAVEKAGRVLFSSATWAKNARNLGVYARLFPKDFDSSNLSDVINKGGDDMHAILTNMLVRDGVMIARQHDLSNCSFEAVFDTEHKERNNAYLARLAPILSEMAYMSGDIGQRLNVINGAKTQELMARYKGDETRVQRTMRKIGLRTVAFGSPLYQITRLCVASLLVDATSKAAILDLEEGRKPLVFTENTIQGLMQDLQAAGDGVEGAEMPDFRDVLKRVVVQLSKVTTGKKDKATGEEVPDPFVETRAEGWADTIAASVRGRMSEGLLADPDPEEPFPPEIGPDGEPLSEEARSPWKAEIYTLLREETDALAARLGIDLGEEANLNDLSEAAEQVRSLIESLHPVRSDNVEILRGFGQYLPPTPLRYRRRIMAMIDRLPNLAASAIDEVRERIESEGRRRFEAGLIPKPWRVGEITGRSLEVRGGVIARREAVSKFQVRNGFNSGEIDALILNAAGATSVSLHAGRRMRDQRRRVMYMLQQHGDIMKFVQAIGRIYRFDQVVGPIIRTPLLDMPAHERLLALQNVKLRRLSANMQSSKEHPASLENIADLMNPVGDKVIMAYAEDHPDLLRRMAMDPAELRQEGGDGDGRDAETRDNDYMAHRFLARLIMLDPDLQVRVLEELRNLYAATLQELADKGENPLETRLVKGIVTAREESVYIDNSDPETDSVFNEPVFLRKVNIEHVEDPLRSGDIGPMLDAGAAAHAMQGLDELSAFLRRNRAAYLRAVLLPGQTIDAALAQGAFAAAQIRKFDRFVEALEFCVPGMVVVMNQEGVDVEGVITSVQVPGEGRTERKPGRSGGEVRSEFLAANYKVTVAVPGAFRPLHVRLSSLLADPRFRFVAAIGGPVGNLPEQDADALMARFDNALEGQRVDRRLMLVGNDWVALQAMNDHRLGFPVAYVDQDGRRQRAVMVLKNAEALDFMPIRLTGPERGTRMAADLLLHGKFKMAGVRSSASGSDLNAISGKSKRGTPLQITYAKRAGYIKVAFPNARDQRFGWLRDVPAVAALMEERGVPDPATQEGHWLETRDCLIIPVGKNAAVRDAAKEDLKSVMRLLMDAGLTFFAPPTTREAVRDWRAKNTPGETGEEPAPDAEPPEVNDDPVARMVA